MGDMLMQGSVVLFLAKATVILIGALVATLVMQRASAGSRHLVWLVTLATLLLVPALTAWGPIRLAVLPAHEIASPVTAPPITPALPTAGAVNSAPTAPPSVAAPQSSSSSAITPGLLGSAAFTHTALTGATAIVALWALVALAIIAVLLRDALVLRRIVRGSTPLDAPEWRDMLWEISDRLELPDAPRLLRSTEAKMPFACGMRRATIVLPVECDAWSHARRRAVLLHELAHVRRHDLLGHMLGRLACAVYWFHPLVWTAAKRLRAESERACDDLALECGTQASDYAEHLLDIVTSVRRASTPTVALAMARRREFEGRMLAILDPDVRRAPPKRWQSGALVVSLAAMAVLVGAATPARKPAQLQRAVLIPSMRPIVPNGEVAPTQKTQTLSDVRGAAQRVASRIADTVAVTVAPSIANDATTSIATHARASLGDRVSSAVSQAVSGIALKLSPEVRATVTGQPALLTQLGRVNGPPSERAALLIKVLQTDTSAQVRRTAAWGLSQLGDVPGVADALAGALAHDSDPGVRANAAWGLGQASRGSAAARDALIAAVQHDADARVRSQAAWSLGARSSSAALPALGAALRDSSARVRSNAAWAIGVIAPRTAPKAVVDALRDPIVEVRANAAWALFNIHDPATATAINAAFAQEANERVQASEIEALGMMGDAGMASIRAALNSSNPHVKAAAVNALAMGHDEPDPNPNPDPNP